MENSSCFRVVLVLSSIMTDLSNWMDTFKDNFGPKNKSANF